MEIKGKEKTLIMIDITKELMLISVSSLKKKNQRTITCKSYGGDLSENILHILTPESIEYLNNEFDCFKITHILKSYFLNGSFYIEANITKYKRVGV